MQRVLTVSVVLLTFVVFVGSVDAQRRRRRRRPPPPEPTEQVQAQEASEEQTPEGEGSPEEPGAEDAPVEVEPAAAPQTEEVEQAAEPAGFEDTPFGPDLGPMRGEFTSIMDELVQVRSRVAVLGRQLFNTRVKVSVQNRAGDDNTLSRFVLSLDGAPIFSEDSGVSEDGRSVFDGFAAPGPHVLTMELEQRARADDDYRYTNRDSFRFQVVRGRLTEVTIVLDDDSDIAEDFADDGEGEYDVRTRVRVATRALGD